MIYFDTGYLVRLYINTHATGSHGTWRAFAQPAAILVYESYFRQPEHGWVA